MGHARGCDCKRRPGRLATPPDPASGLTVVRTAVTAGQPGRLDAAVLLWKLGNKILTPLYGVLFMDVMPITAFAVSVLSDPVPARVQVLGACITRSAPL